MSLISKNKTAKEIIENKDFRHSYVWEHLKRSIPFQIRTMRTEREWSQAKAGEILGKPQNVISRLESPAYGKLSIQTLMEIAEGFDVGLIVKFVPFSRFLNEYNDVSFEALSAASPVGASEIQAIWNWAVDKKPQLKSRRKRPTLSANTSQGVLFLDKKNGAVLQGGSKPHQKAESDTFEEYISKVGAPHKQSSIEQILKAQNNGQQQLEKAA